MVEQSNLLFSFPVQTESQEVSFLNDPKAASHWVKGLSGINIGQAAHQLYKVLHAFNRVILPVKTRLEIAEILLPVVLRNGDKLERYFLQGSFPLSGKDLKVSQLARALQLEMALSYKTCIRDQLQRRTSAKEFALCCHRAMQFHLGILRHEAAAYRNYPKNFWQETHQIYRLALAQKVAQLQLARPGDGLPSTSSIESLFIQVLLFSLSDHYRLRHQDIYRIYQHLPHWSGAARLSSKFDRHQTEHCYCIDLQHNTPPLHLSLVNASDPASEDRLVLDTGGLISLLRQLRDKAKLNNLSGMYEMEGISTLVLDHLSFVWSELPPRKNSRTKMMFELNIAIGLNAIYHLLHRAQQEERASPDNLPGISDRIASLGESSDLLVDLDSAFWRISNSDITHIDDITFLEYDSSKPQWTREQHEEPDAHSYQIVNESAGGYCLSWDADGTVPIKVGELLGIQHETSKRLFSIAVSRWMKYERNKVLLGAAILSQSSSPVEAHLANQQNAYIQHCLLLGDGQGQQTPRLATPPLAFRAGQVVNLHSSGFQIHIRLLKLEDGSASYNIFSYEEVDLTLEQQATNGGPTPAGTG